MKNHTKTIVALGVSKEVIEMYEELKKQAKELGLIKTNTDLFELLVKVAFYTNILPTYHTVKVLLRSNNIGDHYSFDQFLEDYIQTVNNGYTAHVIAEKKKQEFFRRVGTI
ncbi:MAG: hypothetical protein QXV58_14405 [Saccharolobus sp.]|uniref:hypothetical protein n=1 Tax=Saccharolobus sp. TaxID=2100761 RepID=UPI00315F08F9